MAETVEVSSADRKEPQALPVEDLTGRNRMAWNVLSSWAGYLVFVASGFIMPRMIDHRLGQQALGVWDFSWTLVAYFQLVHGGLVSSVNRYVAKYRAAANLEKLNCAVSSVSCILLVMGMVVVALSIATALGAPRLLAAQPADQACTSQWVILFIGLALAVRIIFAGFGGVITGCHRWDLHNGINAACYTGVTVGMIIVLYSGGGLPGLAFACFLGDVLSSGIRSTVVAYRVCPGLSVRIANVRRSMAWEMLKFGGKSWLPNIADLLMNQTTSILLALYLGPGALAVYSRPRSLVRHVVTFLSKFACVMAPTASSLQTARNMEQLQEFYVSSTRYGAYIAFPAVATMAILGSPILHLWMGPRYDNGIVLAVLALGNLSFMVHQNGLSVLLGMNAHGLPGLANLIGAICSIGLGLLTLGPLKLELVGASLSVVIPMTVVNGVFLPIYASRRLGMTLRGYLWKVFLGPLLGTAPYALYLFAVRAVLVDAPATALIAGLCGIPVTLGPIYWFYIVPSGLKRRIIDKCVAWRAALPGRTYP